MLLRPAPTRPATRRIVVSVVSPYDLVRHGIRSLVSDVPGLDVRSPSDSVPSDVDVVLYDLHPQLSGSGLPLLPLPASRVVALVPQIDARATVAAGLIGAVAVLPLAAHRDEVVAVIESAGDPETSPATDHVNPAGLSDRQLEMIALVAAGLSNAEIAERLYLSVNTVKTHLRVAYGRIGISSRARAVTWYLGARVDPSTPPGRVSRGSHRASGERRSTPHDG